MSAQGERDALSANVEALCLERDALSANIEALCLHLMSSLPLNEGYITEKVSSHVSSAGFAEGAGHACPPSLNKSP